MVEGVREVDVGIGLAGLDKAIRKMDGFELFVGYDGASAEAIHTTGKDARVAEIAFWQEFGAKEFEVSGTIPPRSFMELALVDNQEKIADLYQKAIGRILDGKDPETELGKMGGEVVKMIRTKLDSAASWAEPLAAVTVERKGSSTPLRETDKMRDSLRWFVKRGDAIVREGN